MFLKVLKKKKVMKKLLSTVLISTMAISGSAIGGTFHKNTYAAQKHTQYIHKTEQVTNGQYFSKEYEINTKQAGTLSAKIVVKNLGCDFHVSIYGSNSKFYLGNNNIPTLDLTSDKNRNASGVLKTDHIMYADVYKVLIQCKSPAQANGTITTDFTFQPSSCEDRDYLRLNSNDVLDSAKSHDLMDRKYHTYMLSGFSEQQDSSDCFDLYAKKKVTMSLRAKTVSNINHASYKINVIRAKDKKLISSMTPKKALSTKLLHLSAGYYYVQVVANNNALRSDQQILYMIYMAKARKIKSVSLNKKSLALYRLPGYTTGKLISKVNGKKSNSNNVVFRSSRSNVVSVSKAGKLTAKKPGKATITCYAIDKPSVKATCVVTVKNPRLTLKERAKGLYVGDRTRLSVKKVPHTLSVTWKSSNPKVASISSDGTVHGKTAGSAKIYAVSKHGIKSKSCVITVRKKPQPKPKPTPDPKKDPTNQDNHNDTIAPALSLSSAHLSPRGTMLVTANVVGGRFSVSGGISIQSKSGKSCVIKAITSRGTGTIAYTVNGKTASKHIVIY